MPQAGNSQPTGENPVVAKSTLIRRTFQALTYPEFRVLWCGAFVSTVGTWMQKVAQSWLVFTLTGSALLLGFDSFLGELPILLFSLIGGVVADRMDRRRLLLTSQYLQMTFALTLAALIYFDKVSVWQILLLSFLTGSAQAFGGPAYQSLIPTLVEKKDISNAIALNSIQFNLARIIGPVIAGLAFTALGAAACFLLNGISFLAVIFSLSSLKSLAVPNEVHGKLLDELRSGLSFVRSQPILMTLSFLAFCSTFFGVPLITMLPVFAKDVFHLGPRGYSGLLACTGVGAVIGALVVAALGNFSNKGRIALALQVVFGATTMRMSAASGCDCGNCATNSSTQAFRFSLIGNGGLRRDSSSTFSMTPFMRRDCMLMMSVRRVSPLSRFFDSLSNCPAWLIAPSGLRIS
jgi:MFS family permease